MLMEDTYIGRENLIIRITANAIRRPYEYVLCGSVYAGERIFNYAAN